MKGKFLLRLVYFAKVLDRNLPFSDYLWLSMNYQATFLNFGYIYSVVSTVNSTGPNPYRIWMINVWHSVCLAFDAKRFHLLLVKVAFYQLGT